MPIQIIKTPNQLGTEYETKVANKFAFSFPPNKKGLLMQALLKVSNQHGLADLSMATLAKEVGLSQGSIYRYFETKEELLNQTYLHCRYQLSDKLNLAIDSELPVPELFLRYYKNIFNCLKHNHLVYSYLQAAELTFTLSEATLKETETTLVPLTLFINKAQNQNMFTKANNAANITQIIYKHAVFGYGVYRQMPTRFTSNEAHYFAELCCDWLKTKEYSTRY